MRKIEVVALGELLIDFTENGISEQGNLIFEANPGGAPCNSLAMLNKLGRTTAFIGKVGADSFGKLLKQKLDSLGIDTRYLYFDNEVNTTLAFVHTLKDGDREFSFYRNPGADMMLTADEVPVDIIKEAKVFQFGTLSMTHTGVKEATLKALKIAKASDTIIYFDPNIRKPLWDNLEHAKKETAIGLDSCSVLKISDNEIQWFTGKQNFDEGIAYLQERYNIKLIVLSLGKAGSRAYYTEKTGKNLRVEAKTFLDKKTIETTGAGDSFGACVIHHVLDIGLDNFNELNLKQMLIFANAAATIVTTKKGALSVMPEKSEVLELLKNYSGK